MSGVLLPLCMLQGNQALKGSVSITHVAVILTIYWEGVAYFCNKLAAGNDMVETLWVRVKGQANKVDIVVGVYYRPPCQDDNNNDLLFKGMRYL